MVTISDQTNEQINECSERTAPKHTVFADTGEGITKTRTMLN